ncbi:adenylate/guanylate cyclase domain-containing protein [Kaistia sp. MMO-174]|uniref:adenylate/guanylate cyclase domain-containing protein n=1 Tax=Kaistia sp. MMO-174 TaxID=3081256 RepID=UPI00301A7A92
MALLDDLTNSVKTTFAASWSTRNGTVVPVDTDLSLGNDGVKLTATVLYADLSESTKLVDSYPAALAAEIYKTFLQCAARIIRSENGAITAYDGDRVMAVYIGDLKNTQAARTALKINWACKNIIQPAYNKQYPDRPYALKHTVGIDTSEILVARAGIRGSNDLVWIGRAANWAAKLCALDHDYPSWITAAVFEQMATIAKTSIDGRPMWEAQTWTAMNSASIYRSHWSWQL